MRDIRYEVDASPEPTTSSNMLGAGKAAAVPVPQTVAPTPQLAAQTTPAIATVQVSDVPVTAKEIVITIIAQKLGKTFSGVSRDKTIKQLTGGSFSLAS